jgi:hypothetical protein
VVSALARLDAIRSRRNLSAVSPDALVSIDENSLTVNAFLL